MEELRLTHSFYPRQNKQNKEFIEFQLDKQYKFTHLSQGIILLKQNYQTLYQNKGKLKPPLVDKILVTLTDVYGKDQVQIKIQRSQIQIQYINNIMRTSKAFIKTKQFKLLPKTVDDAWNVFQRKLWIQINKRLNYIAVFAGDIQTSKPCEIISRKLAQIKPKTWQNDLVIYKKPQKGQIPQPINQQDLPNRLRQLSTFKIKFIVFNDKQNSIERIGDFYKIQLLKVKRKQGSILQKNPSLLKRTIANLQGMPQQIKILYSYLQNLCLKRLPQFQINQNNKASYYDYINWNNLRFGIHSSLTTQYGLIDGKPIGILNHLFQVKAKKKYTTINTQGKNAQQIKQEIFNQRRAYIRMEAIPHQGISPGSSAVLEIWPPFCCSSVHNHGQAYGLIKVLSGEIRVQNFLDLSFNIQTPYLESDYPQGSYTWLSEYSFGIHRLVNVHPQTCITLQAYFNSQNSNEYFSFIDQKQNKKYYKKYYPQHDWANYLRKTGLTNQDQINFIDAVIDKYKLKKDGEIDVSFMKFCLVIKQQYNTLSEYLKSKI